MALSFNLMENDVFRPLILKAQTDNRQEGRQEGVAAMLLKQLRRKFGPVPDGITAKITSAKLELVETWIDNFVFTNSLDDVFVS